MTSSSIRSGKTFAASIMVRAVWPFSAILMRYFAIFRWFFITCRLTISSSTTSIVDWSSRSHWSCCSVSSGSSSAISVISCISFCAIWTSASTSSLSDAWLTVILLDSLVVCTDVDVAAMRTVKLKHEPFPSSDSTSNCPPCCSINCLVTLKPNPVPPYSLAVEASTCSKTLKIPVNLSFGMPIPVSVTETFKNGSVTCAVTITVPVSVNLMALPSRL